MEIYYDSIQEGVWFQSLHPSVQKANLLPFPKRNSTAAVNSVLAYDRPDIVLVDNGTPILVVERTVEVPSGHNVGQRFARLVAAAQLQIPIVYFGPYAAYKHGGATQGPRYMNLRLFYSLSNIARIENTAVTIINWPVDANYEVIQNPTKDLRLREYLQLFLNLYQQYGQPSMNQHIMCSSFEQQQDSERRAFIAKDVKNPEQYDSPPDSVQIIPNNTLNSYKTHNINLTNLLRCTETVLYKIGMNYIRSDPYAGCAMLYAYLYCGGMKKPTRNLVLHFPGIAIEEWQATSQKSSDRKDLRLFKLVADGIIFANGYLPKSSL